MERRAHTGQDCSKAQRKWERNTQRERERSDKMCNEEGRSDRKEEEHKKKATKLKGI